MAHCRCRVRAYSGAVHAGAVGWTHSRTVRYTANITARWAVSQAWPQYGEIPDNVMSTRICRRLQVAALVVDVTVFTVRRGLTFRLLRLTLTILLTSRIANSFSRPLSQVTVCTIFTLLKPPPTVLISFVRGNIHTCFPLFNIRSLKTLISIVVYLNMYNPLIIILCFFHQFILHVLCFVFYIFCILCISMLFHFATVCDCHTE